MKKILKILICMGVVFSLVACGKKSEKESVNKEGTKYEIGDDVSFYYPNEYTFNFNKTDDNKNVSSIELSYKNQTMYYYVEGNILDNNTSDMDELYQGELEELGAVSIEVKKPVLESGLECYEFSGKIKETGMKFTDLVYFDEHYTYVYGYKASEEDYDDNIDRIIVFLETFTKATGKS